MKPEELVAMNAPEMFGVTTEQAEEMTELMLRSAKENRTMEAVAEALDLHRSGMLAFKAYLFGRLAEQNDRNGTMHVKLMLMKKLRDAVGDEMFKKAFEAAFKDFKQFVEDDFKGGR